MTRGHSRTADAMRSSRQARIRASSLICPTDFEVGQPSTGPVSETRTCTRELSVGRLTIPQLIHREMSFHTAILPNSPIRR